MIATDPILTDPEHYRLLWENDYVRVLEYADLPGTQTLPHEHPNSVMVTLSDFDRRITAGGTARDLTLRAGRAVWLPAQRHSGKNIGVTPTHTIFVELKGASAGGSETQTVGPTAG